MRENIDVHRTKHRYDLAIRNLKADKAISVRNRKAILKFVWDLQAEGIGLKRLLKYVQLLAVVGRGSKRIPHGLGKDFEKATVDDIKRFVVQVNQSNYADWTKQDLRITLKRFYRWLRHLPDDKDPPETCWIRTSNNNGKRILPEELLTPEDVQKMLQVCENSRDRAFLSCVDETGGRIAELLNLRRKHVQFDDMGAQLVFSGKTGDRRDRIVVSVPPLAQWMLDHPSKEPDSPLWLVIADDDRKGDALLYDGARLLLRRLAEKAGVRKRVNPHSFRHARATALASIFTESQMQQYLGWVPGSRMAKTYVHLSGKETDLALLRFHGLAKETEESKTPRPTVRICPRCEKKNTSLERFCASCGLALSVEAAMEVDESRKEADSWLDLLLKDTEVKELLLTKLRELIQASVQKSSAEVPSLLPGGPVEQGREAEGSIGVEAKRSQELPAAT